MIIYCDGASNPKTKRSGIGAVWFNEDQLSNPLDGRTLNPDANPQLSLSREIYGSKTKYVYPTNNEAEYISLIEALKLSIEKEIPHVTVFMDSKLVVNQVNGVWKINYDHLRELKDRVCELSKSVGLKLIHIRREYNAHADKQSKDCIKGPPKPRFHLEPTTTSSDGCTPKPLIFG